MYQLTKCSNNKKTGPIPVSISGAATCPDSCPLKSKGCYAKYGPMAMAWRRVDRTGWSWSEFVAQVRKLPRGTLWRHNQAGDLPGKGDRIAPAKLRQLVEANRKGAKRGFTYTHKPMTSKTNRDAVREANAGGFTVNLSANDLAHADELAALDIGPVVTILPRDAKGSIKTPGGRKVAICPATLSDVQCSQCGVCANADRKTIIGFPAHGAASKTASEVANG